MDIYFILFICWNKITLMQQMAQLLFFFPSITLLKQQRQKQKVFLLVIF